jgi:hypothetical protein
MPSAAIAAASASRVTGPTYRAFLVASSSDQGHEPINFSWNGFSVGVNNERSMFVSGREPADHGRSKES